MGQGESISSKLFDYLEPIAFVVVVFSQPITMRRAGKWVSLVVCSDAPITFRILA